MDQEVTEILHHHVGTKDCERLDVTQQLLDGKQRSLSEIDHEVLSLCQVEAIDEMKKLNGSEKLQLQFSFENGKTRMQARQKRQLNNMWNHVLWRNNRSVIILFVASKLAKFKGDVTK